MIAIIDYKMGNLRSVENALQRLATSFITPFGMYCYITMPFGLRNAGATYQRCMNHVF